MARVRDQQRGPAVGQGHRKRQIAASTLLRASVYVDQRGDRGLFTRSTAISPARLVAPTLGRGPEPDTKPRALRRRLQEASAGRDRRDGDNARELVRSLFPKLQHAMTSLGSGLATSSTRSSTPSPRASAWSCPPRAGRSPARTSRPSSAIIECNRGLHPKDDIDHLGNRRIRANGASSRTRSGSASCAWSAWSKNE